MQKFFTLIKLDNIYNMKGKLRVVKSKVNLKFAFTFLEHLLTCTYDVRNIQYLGRYSEYCIGVTFKI